MKFHTLQAILVLIAHLLVTACGSASGGKVADRHSQNAANRALTENDLANASYRIDRLGEFRLYKGEFKRQYGAGMTQAHKVTLEKIASGDLDDDGLGDAAVILAWQSGGSGTFRYLVAVRNTGNAPQQQDSVLLGDRIQIKALSIDTGQAHLETVMAGPHDPACCPSQQTKQAFSLHDGKWEQSADQIADSNETITSNAALTGIVWQWARFEDTSEPYYSVIDDPNKYTLILLPNGSYQAKADCNRMQGQYTLEGRRIKIVPGPSTLTECEAGSRYLEYLGDLTEAVSFVLHANKLVLNLVMDGERLVFEHGGEVSDNHKY